MEQVPGGSLSALLRSKWGPLKDNESTIAFYSKQILEGLKYLHDQKIVHRDIKGDNVLVNTYSGVLKISDFGTSKRLAGINPNTETFAGTLQYMAPEVIDQGFRGYGPAADVWSFGCTNVEMATGKPPFVELGSPQAAMFKVGFYKSHPEIPEMSSSAERFILRCFEVDVDKRATAAQLLEDPFLSEKHRKSRILNPPNNTEFTRSVSVPADRMISKNATPFNPITTPVTPDLDTSMSTRTSPKTLSRTHLAPIQIPIPIIMTHSLACSPLIDTDHDVDTTFSLNRRSSSGVLLSPDVEMTGSISKPLTEASESDGFYMLKKDSQRRTTLSKVLTHDEQKICDVWMDKIENNHNVQVVISKEHLETMSRALRDYIIDQNTESLQNVLISLKKNLSSDATAIDHLHLALYSFQDAVNTVLRSHSIKPHWMFALDSLVSNAVQAAITVLSPELGANLAGRLDTAEEEEMSTSGVSTVNSTKMKPIGSDSKYLNEEFSKLKVQNMHLMQNLLESHKLYQALLKSTIEEQRLNLDLLRNFSSQLTNATVLYERSISQGYHSDVSDMAVGRNQNDVSTNSITEVDAINNNNNNRNLESNSPRKSVLITNQNPCKADAQPKIASPGRRLIGNREQNALPVDARLNDWLITTNIDPISKNIILAEQFTYDDFIYGMEKTDLQRIGLKCGVEVKVWRAIIKHRTQFPDTTD